MVRSTRGSSHPACPLAGLTRFPPPLCTDGSSESLSEQMDSEDQAAPSLPPGPAELQKAKGGLLGGTFPAALAPLYFIKNMIPKQVAPCVSGQSVPLAWLPQPGHTSWPPPCPAPCPKECPVDWGVGSPCLQELDAVGW